MCASSPPADHSGAGWATTVQHRARRLRRRGIVVDAMLQSLQSHPQFALAGLLGWVALYLLYKVGWRRDYGLPVRRRLLITGLRVEREQLALVPFWWSDIQVQRALDAHWRRTLRRGFEQRASRSG
jgi:hypothetical protein